VKLLLLAGVALFLSGCATRGTIAELGRPEFSGALPADERLTLVEPRELGSFHAYPRGSGEGDYHCQTQMRTPAHREGDDIAFDLDAQPTGDQRINLLDVLVYPLLDRDQIRFQRDGHPPGGAKPVAHAHAEKAVPGSERLHVDLRFPAAAVAGFDQLGMSVLIRFEDGWISIIDRPVSLPAR
jgi:hypothetical protein